MQPEFSLSLTRIRTYEHCLWAYYLHYYSHSSRAGLAPKRGIDKSNISVQRGIIVHEWIKKVLLSLEKGTNLTVDDIIRYGTEIGEKEDKSIALCAEHFFESEVYRELQQLDKGRILSVEGSDVNNKKGIERFVYCGVPVDVKIDLAYLNNKGRVIIVDWKTGKNKETISNFTLPLYALYAIDQDWAEPNNIICVEYNLTTQNTKSKLITVEVVSELERKLNSYLGGMRKLLANEQKNRPVETIYFVKDGKEKCHCSSCEYSSHCN